MHKIMLVEDDASMLMLLRTLLEIEGYSVVQLQDEINENSLLATLRRERPELVLMDVHLHNTNGLDLLQSIRQDGEISATHVIMSSGMELSIRCRQAGADDFILKPYMPDELVAKIRAILGVRG
jgi:DNA-binding response OmpR family regulator